MLKHLFIRKQLALLLFLPLLTGTNLSAAAPASSGKSPSHLFKESNEPISITSDKMVFQNLKDKIIFEGTVVIKKEGLLLESERAEIFLIRRAEPSETGAEKQPQQVSKIIASGNVRINKGTQYAKAEKGTFDRIKEVLVLTGNPELWEEGYHIKGEEIIFFMKEERTLVTQSEVLIQNASGGLNLSHR